MDYYLLTDMTAQIGYELAAAGAETFRIEETMRRVLSSARLERISVLANPNYGPHTTLEEIVSGVERVHELVGERPVDFVCALEKHCPALGSIVKEPVIPIRLHTLPDWMLE